MSGEISPAGNPVGNPATAGPGPELRASHADRDRVVDALAVAAGDGRLTSDELDERLEAALNARTLSELAVLTADLPAVAPGGGVAQVKDVVRIEQRFSAVRRTGAWVVPRRLEIDADWSEVTLDFTEAVITQSTLQIDVSMRGKNLTLIVGPGVVVDADGLQLEFSKLRYRRTPDHGGPVRLRIELVGHKTFGRVIVRQRRRGFAQWLLRKPAPLGQVGAITSR